MRFLLAFAAAFVVSLGLILWLGEPGAAVWTRLLGPLGAGSLAAVVVSMREGFVPDLIKAVVFTGIGGVLLFQGIPPWMAWPVVVGPWAGLAFNQGGRRGGEVHSDRGDGRG